MSKPEALDPLTFKSFYDEVLEIAGGWHDSEKATLDYAGSANEVLGLHEEVHGRIFRETPEGKLVGALFRLGRSDGNDAFRSLAERLLDSSRDAHETFATYLSIKSLGLEQHIPELERYPSYYSRLYQRLAGSIDTHFRSSYLQYLVAVNIMNLVFASPFPARFLGALPQLSAPAPGETANARLDTLVDSLNANSSLATALVEKLNEVVANVCAAHLVEPWDVQDELGWERAPNDVARKVEVELASPIVDWLAEATGLTMHEDSPATAAARTGLQRGSRGVVVENLRSSSQVGDPEWEKKYLRDTAWTAARNVIANPDLAVIGSPLSSSDFDDETLPNPLVHRVTVGALHFASEKFTAMITTPAELPRGITTTYVAVGFQLDGEEERRAFVPDDSTLLRRWVAKSPSPVSAAVLGVGDNVELLSWMRQLASLSAPPSPGTRHWWDASVLFWYPRKEFYIELLGRFSKPAHVYHAVTYRKGVDVLFHVIQKARDEFYIRAFSKSDSAGVGAYEKQLISEGRLINGVSPHLKNIRPYFDDALAFCCHAFGEL